VSDGDAAAGARWRSVLFVPATRADLAAKTERVEPDVVVIDLEDAVPPAQKADARATAVDAVAAVGSGPAVLVRVNAPDSPWFDGDAAELPDDIAGVVVPKLESAEQVDRVGRALGGRPIVAGLETVRGVADARHLLGPPVVACYFGAEDYVADLGGIRTVDNAEVLYPRAHVGLAARLAGVAALDMVTLDFGDDDRFRREAAEARALGYAGKLCIHPAQVGLANEAFRPSADEIDWAQRLLAAFDEAGGATIAFEGQMVDEVVAARARAVLAAAEA
jgi:citrate lyase subunit beta/citryl-CoA lyase